MVTVWDNNGNLAVRCPFCRFLNWVAWESPFTVQPPVITVTDANATSLNVDVVMPQTETVLTSYKCGVCGFVASFER